MGATTGNRFGRASEAVTAGSGPGSRSAVEATAGSAVSAAGAGTRRAARHLSRFGHVGWMAKGLVYALVGLLFIRIAVGDGGGGSEANQAGAVESIAGTAFGAVLLAVLAVGMVLYVAWRGFTVVLPGDWTGRALLQRIGYAASALVYVSLLVTTVEILAHRNRDPGSSEDRRIEAVVSDTLDLPVGRTLVIAAGLVVIGIGVVFVRTGLTGGYRDTMRAGDDGVEGMAIDRLGTAGWIARGIALFPIGAFVVHAAWTYRPDEAGGFDDAIRELGSHPLGAVVAVVIGLGFIAYGLFAALSARYQLLEGPRNDG